MALETELQYYESRKPELLQHHEGKYALIVGQELLGVFDDREAAYKAGVAQKGNVPMLIKRISRVEGVESVPAMVLPYAIVTRETLLRMAEFNPVADVRKAIDRTREALDATRADDAPDHRVRLEAADRIFALADVAKPRTEEAPSERPIAIAIVLNGHSPEPRAAIQGDGLTIHLDGDHGG